MKWRGRLQNLRDLGELTLRWVIIALLFSIPVKAHGKKATGKKAPSAVEDLTLKEGDEKSNDMRALKTEMLVAKSETLAISQINKLIKKYKGTSMEADMWFRLAELHMRRSKTERFFEIHRTSETVVSLAPNQARNASSKKAVMEAISVYEMIERKFKTYPEMDLVVFNSAFARQTIGQTKEAEATYWRLIRTFPRSYLIPDAHLAIGEMAFDGKRFQLALDHFEAIKKYPESRVYPYGLYKAAWSHYNLRQPGEGLKELEKTVEYGRKVAESGDENKLDLRKEALMDMTVFFEDVHQASIAYNYFKAQAAELDFAPYLIRLSDLYKRHSRFDDRKVLLSEFVKRSDESSYVPRAHEELIWNYDHLKDKVAAVKQMTALEKVCHPKSSWLRAQKPEPGTPPEALPGVECSHRLRDVTLKLANRWLAMWKKNLTYPDFADSSERAYEIYLVHALPGDEASQARFAYSELLFQRNKFREASHHYALVGQGTTDAKLRHDSQYAAIVSLEKAVKDQWSAKDEEQYYKLAKTYLDGNPKGQYVADIEFKSALIHYEKSRYDQAAPLFVKLGNATPATEKSLKAQDLYLDILNIKKDYEGLKAYSKTLAKGPQTPERKAKLQTIYEQAFFLQVQKAEESGDVATAVAGYQKFTQENPKSPLAEKAL